MKKDASKLTREEAIEKTIEMWEELAETGDYDKDKTKLPRKYDNLICGCFLCTLVSEEGYSPRCRKCPYSQHFHGQCCTQNRPYQKWEDTFIEEIELRKRYAGQFLEQLKQLA